MKLKPNYKTSEFWFTLATVVVSLLYMIGIMDGDQKDDIISNTSSGLEAVFLLSGQAVVLYKYISERSEQKKVQADVELAKEIAKQIKIHEESKEEQEKEKNDKPRTNTRRSRKTNK